MTSIRGVHASPRVEDDQALVPRAGRFAMKKTRLQGALADSHADLSKSTDDPQLQEVYQLVLQRNARGRCKTSRPQAQPVEMSSEQATHARDVLHQQLDAMNARLYGPNADLDASSRLQMLLRTADVPKRANQHDEKHEEGARQWYIMGKVVGTGTFGRVHAARHRVSDDRVAIKSYFRDKGALVCCPAPSSTPKKPSHLTDPLEWKRVRREAALMAALPVHPGLVQLVEVFETPTQLQLVMECVDGGSLYDLLKRQPHQKLTEAHAKRLFAQLCAALAALHAHNIIHRDLKLENILLDEHDRPRIIDFGFSQTESMRSDGRDVVASAVKNFCGTPSYMAPEVVSCKRYDGKRVDVWSLGVLLYLLLCGKFPFQGQSIHQLYQNIRATSLAFPSSLSKDAQHLLQGILVVDPAKRFTLSEIQDHPWLHTMFQSEILAQEHAFTALMVWQEAHDVLRMALDLPKDETNDTKGSKPRKGVSALVFLLLLRVEKQFFAQFVKKTVSTQSIQQPTAPDTSITHKQQLEQLIGLVKSSLR